MDETKQIQPQYKKMTETPILQGLSRKVCI